MVGGLRGERQENRDTRRFFEVPEESIDAVRTHKPRCLVLGSGDKYQA